MVKTLTECIHQAIEPANLIMRMQMRRFTRLTNGFSKKVENHAYAVAIHYALQFLSVR
jgi:IS1 family transposase